jgi:hypothetical protein
MQSRGGKQRRNVMSKLVIRELTETTDLDQSEMKEVIGGEQKEVYIFSSETLSILGKTDAARVRELEEKVLAGGHHE